MAVKHKIDENELIEIFDSFIDEVVDGDVDKDVMEFLHVTLSEMADGNEVMVQGSFANLIADFISLFTFDDVNGGYTFQFNGIVAQGNTTILRD